MSKPEKPDIDPETRPSRNIFRRLYHWMMKWGQKPHAEWALFGFSFSESSFFPIPPDPLLIAITLSKPKKWLRLATICTLASVVGGILGYYIGAFLYESVGQAIIETYHLQEGFNAVEQRYQANAFLAILGAGFTPIPYKIFTIAAGVFAVDLKTLIIASLLGRGGRFLTVAWLTQKLGARYKDQIEKYIDLLSIVFLVLLVLGFFVIKYV